MHRRAEWRLLAVMLFVAGLVVFSTVDTDGDPITSNGPAVVLTAAEKKPEVRDSHETSPGADLPPPTPVRRGAAGSAFGSIPAPAGRMSSVRVIRGP